MPLRAGKTIATGGILAEYRYPAEGFQPASQKPAVEFRRRLDAEVYDEALFASFGLPAGVTQTVDLRLFQTFSQAVTGAAAIGLAVRITAEAAGGKVRIRPGVANPLTWFFGSATDSLTINATASGDAGLSLLDGTAVTVSDAERNIDFTNTGSAEVTVRVMAIVGT